MVLRSLDLLEGLISGRHRDVSDDALAWLFNRIEEKWNQSLSPELARCVHLCYYVGSHPADRVIMGAIQPHGTAWYGHVQNKDDVTVELGIQFSSINIANTVGFSFILNRFQNGVAVKDMREYHMILHSNMWELMEAVEKSEC